MYTKVELTLPSGNIMTVRPDNLLDIQMFEAFVGAMNNTNTQDLLTHLEDISKNGLPKIQ